MSEAERERTTAQRQVNDLNRQREAITGYLDELRSLLGQDPAPNEQMLARVAQVEEDLNAATDEMDALQAEVDESVDADAPAADAATAANGADAAASDEDAAPADDEIGSAAEPRSDDETGSDNETGSDDRPILTESDADTGLISVEEDV